MEDEKYQEVYQIIENVEVNSKVRMIQDNTEKLNAYWQIGKLIVEAQKGNANYGDKIIRKMVKETN